MKLNYKRTICVGFAFFLICTFWQAYDTIIPKILTDRFGMSQTLSGVIMALDNILALFMLPLFGVLSDRCRSRLGRRTPYILFGTVMAVIAFIALSFVDSVQLKKIEAVTDLNDAEVRGLLYDYDYAGALVTPDGEEFVLSEKFTAEQFAAIPSADDTGATTDEYTDYVVPARQAYIRQEITKNNPSVLIFFIALLLVVLVSMATFRTPAVALMPDVTVKPLRSKANAVINLMGTIGGSLVLGLGIVLKTGKTANTFMSYTGYFCIVSGIMIVCLFIFMLTVREKKFVREMEETTEKFGLEEINGTEYDNPAAVKLPRAEMISLVLILASVVFWFFGYNAVTSKYSVYAGNVLNLDYNSTLLVANIAALISYLPVGFIATKIGRKKTILAGVLMLGASFLTASFLDNGTPLPVMMCIFALAGIGWATINVNSFPMVVELARGGNVGRYTGFYYTASMAAQTLTPIVSGFLMDSFSMKALFPYATVFVAMAFVTMLFVRHGDSVPAKKTDVAEYIPEAD